jgi:hypothetical protein
MYDDIAILKAYGEPTYDGYGNEFIPEIDTTVFVQPRGVYQSEFYNAVLETWKADYPLTVVESVWEQVTFDRSYEVKPE